MTDRILGSYSQGNSGPLVLLIGALHGNEPAGVHAIDTVLQLLECESRSNPGFAFHGKIVGLIGNKAAYRQDRRFVDSDLNRHWIPEKLQLLVTGKEQPHSSEDLEAIGLFKTIQAEIAGWPTNAMVLLDLHTTSAGGGIFCIPTDESPSLRLAKSVHAPVVLGLMDGIQGALLQFGIERRFHLNGRPEHTVGMAFEAGRHDDPASVSRAVAVILACLRAAGCMEESALFGRHDVLMREFSRNLPKVTRLRYVHHLHKDDLFCMRPGYHNFQIIQQGEHLADDRHGAVLAPMDGLILMPLYQAQGSDGFFVVEEIA